jgi:hypothetical protein
VFVARRFLVRQLLVELLEQKFLFFFLRKIRVDIFVTQVVCIVSYGQWSDLVNFEFCSGSDALLSSILKETCIVLLNEFLNKVK